MVASEEIIVYSCITGGRDKVKNLTKHDDFKYVLFTDKKIEPCGWETVLISGDSLKIARWHKHHPHVLFPKAKFTIWIDGTHWPYKPLKPLIGFLKNNVIAASKHFCRSDVASEAIACKGELASERIPEQVNFYKKNGFPDNLGLYETSYLVRKNCDELANLQKMWWDQLDKFSMRDQISLTYCLWKLNIDISVIPGYCRHGSNDFFKMRPHRKNPSLILF